MQQSNFNKKTLKDQVLTRMTAVKTQPSQIASSRTNNQQTLSQYAQKNNRFQNTFRKKKQSQFNALTRTSAQNQFGGQRVDTQARVTGQRIHIVKQYHQKHQRNPIIQEEIKVKQVMVREIPRNSYQLNKQFQRKYLLPADRTQKPKLRYNNNKSTINFGDYPSNHISTHNREFKPEAINSVIQYNFAQHTMPTVTQKIV